MSEYSDFNSIVSEEDEVAFLVKYYPELSGHEEILLEFIIDIKMEVLGKYKHRINVIRRLKEKERAAIRSKRAKLKAAKEKLESLSEDINPELLDELDEKSQELESELADKSQGNQRQVIAHVVAKSLKDFWAGVLGHKNFYYGEKQNRHTDLANNFADLFIRVVFRGESKTGFQHALTSLSDPKRGK